jgi:formylglycine-generating enzyme required for sulfatase activity
MNRYRISLLFTVLITTLLLWGCSSDDPVDVGNQTGSVIINIDPDSLEGAWTLTMPGGKTISGSGDSTLSSIATGEYSIVWGDIPGWYSVHTSPVSDVLEANANLEFICQYAEETDPTGSIMIDPNPDFLIAPWSLKMPGNVTVSGLGDTLIQDLGIGSYTLTWRSSTGWAMPQDNPVTKILEADSTLEFPGQYTEIIITTGTVIVDVEPESLEPAWTLELPDQTLMTGAGDSTMIDMPEGEYTLTFASELGWLVPDINPQTATLVAESSITFTGTYELENPETGSVFVNCEPDGLDIPWTLYRSDTQVATGVGDSLLTDMSFNQYLVLWGAVDGWIPPDQNPMADILYSETTLEFVGSYTEINWDVGTIIVDPDPNSLDAPWELLGPDGSSRIDRGDQELPYMPVGEYTLNWGPVANFLAPLSITLQLDADATITFQGQYIYNDPTELYKLIEKGTFWMGSEETQAGRLSNEPEHLVTLTRDYWLKTNEVTFYEYCDMLQWAYDREYVTVFESAVYDNLDDSSSLLVDLDDLVGRLSFVDGVFDCVEPNKPMVEISWYGAAAYCDWLNMREGYPRSYEHHFWSVLSFSTYNLVGYRLPTEAEWELACGLGSRAPFNTGECLDSTDGANFNGNYPYESCAFGPYVSEAADVGSYNPNLNGLYDMHGNVWEWCWDGERELSSDPVTDPEGSSTATDCILRGGAWDSPGVECRTARRRPEERIVSFSYIGFRVARTK